MIMNETTHRVDLPKTQNYHNPFPLLLTMNQFLFKLFYEAFWWKRYDVCSANSDDRGCLLNTCVMSVSENIDFGG